MHEERRSILQAIAIALAIMWFPLILMSLMFYSMMLGYVSVTVETPVRDAIQYNENAHGRQFWQMEIVPPPHELTIAIPDQIVREAEEADIEAYVRVTFTCSHCEHSEVAIFNAPFEFEEDYTLRCKCWTFRFRQSISIHFVTGSHAYYAGPTRDYKEPDTILQYDYPTIKWTDLDFDAETGTLFHEESGMQFTILTDGYHFTDPIDDNRRTHIVPDSSGTAPNDGLFELDITGGKLLAVAYRPDHLNVNWESDYIVSQETMEIDLHFFRDYGFRPYGSCSLVFFVSDDQGQCYLLPITLSEDMVEAANR